MTARLDLLVARRVRALASHLPPALAGDIAGVHQARVATRRLREALPVLTADLDDRAGRRVQKQLRRTTRALGPVREADVARAVFEEWAAGHMMSRGARQAILDRLERERGARRAHMLHTLRGKRVPKMLDGLASLVKALRARPPGDLWIGLLGLRLGARAQTLRTAIEEAGLIYLPDRLHRVRIAAKKLRYALELVHEAHVAPTTRLTNRLKAAQDLLGRLHDLEMLEHLLERQPLDRRRGEPDLSAQLELACRAIHGDYLGRHVELIRVADTVIDRLVSDVHARAVGASNAAVR